MVLKLSLKEASKLGIKFREERKRYRVESHLEELLFNQIIKAGLPTPLRQHRLFAIEVGRGAGVRARLAGKGWRDFKFDFFFVDYGLLIEVDGGTWIQGRHNRGQGIEDDKKKYCDAMLLGHDVVSFTGGMVKSGDACVRIKRLLEMKGWSK